MLPCIPQQLNSKSVRPNELKWGKSERSILQPATVNHGKRIGHKYKRDIKLLMRDWNAKVRNNNEGMEQVMGQYGIGNRNDNED